MPKITLPPVNSFEEYEKLKLSNGMFESAAREIVAYHHLSNWKNKVSSLSELEKLVWEF